MAEDGVNMPDIDILRIGSFVAAPATTYDRPTSADYSELLWFVEGTSRLECSSSSYTLTPNTVVLNPAGTRYNYFWDPDSVTRMGYVIFAAPAGDEGPLLRHLAADDVILALLNHLLWLDGARCAGWQDQARQALIYVLHAYRNGTSATSSLSDRELPLPIERSMALVRTRWSPGSPFRTPSLDELAEAAAVSREHLCRVYKKELGYGPIAALRLLRLRYTAALLKRTHLTVGEVAYQGGFESQFHFSRTFKQAFGISPTEFRGTSLSGLSLPNSIRRLGMYF